MACLRGALSMNFGSFFEANGSTMDAKRRQKGDGRPEAGQMRTRVVAPPTPNLSRGGQISKNRDEARDMKSKTKDDPKQENPTPKAGSEKDGQDDNSDHEVINDETCFDFTNARRANYTSRWLTPPHC